MVFNRQAAINFLKRSTLCNGLTMEYPGRTVREGFQRAYIMNDAGLMGTALKQAGDPSWTLIRDTIQIYNDKFGYNNSKNYFHPILDQAVVTTMPAFKPATETILFERPDAGDDYNPKQVLHHLEPADPLSDTCGDIPINRALMRALYHWQQGQTSTANTCYDFVIANRRPEGWALADVGPEHTDYITTPGTFENSYKYRVYKQMIQWIAAKDMGRTRLYTDVLDVMQDPAHGGVRTFFKTNYSYIAPDDFNTETTSLAIIADIRWNPGSAPGYILDTFGVRHIYESKSGGGSWASTTWDDSTRTFGTPGDCSKDPADSNFDVDGGGNPKIIINGIGHMNMWTSNDNAGSPRVSVIGNWQNVESTIYVRSPSTSMINNFDLRSKTQHYCTPSATCTTDCFGGYIHNIDFDSETVYFRKEKTHAAGYTNKLGITDISLISDTWYGFKAVCFNLPNGDVRLETWLDRTGGVGGGSWEKIAQITDDGNWTGSGGIGGGEPDTLVCQGSAIRANLNGEIGSKPHLDFKSWTIREINPPVL